MEFVGVEFKQSSGGGVAIVHESWLTPRKQEVYWPPYKFNSRYINVLKKGEAPTASWSLYQIKRSFFHSGDYDTAHKKLKLCQNESDIGTDLDVEYKVPEKRIRRPPARTLFDETSSDTDEPGPSCLPRPPRVNDSLTVIPNARCKVDEIDSDDESLTSVQKILTFKENIESNKVTPTTKNIFNSSLSNSNGGGNIHTPRSRTDVCEILTNEVSQEKFWKILLEIQELNKEILARLKQQEAPTGSRVALDIPVQLPIYDIEDINLLETHLEEKQHVTNLSLYLSTLGGRDVPTKTNRILKNVLSNTVASQFSFFGSRSEKHAFSNLKLKMVIVEAVKRDTTRSTDKEVEDVVKVWLKHAPKRLKAEALRK